MRQIVWLTAIPVTADNKLSGNNFSKMTRADRLAGKATITGGLRLARSEVLKTA